MSSSTCTCRFFGRAPSADRLAVSRRRSSSCCLTLCTPIRPTPPSRLLLICPTSSSRIIHWRRRRPSPPPTTTPAQRAAVRVSVLLLEFIGNENESLFAPPLSSVRLFVNGADTQDILTRSESFICLCLHCCIRIFLKLTGILKLNVPTVMSV